MPWWNMPHQYFDLTQPRGLMWFFPTLTLIVLWSLIWKGMALYRAARNEQKGWFITLLIVNTLGILEIIYLLLFASMKTSRKKKS